MSELLPFSQEWASKTGRVFASTCKLTLELKFRAQATGTLKRSLINEDERLLAIKEWMLHASTVSGELDFSLLLKCWVQIHVAFSSFIHCRKWWLFFFLIYLRLINPNGSDCSSVVVKHIHEPLCVGLLLRCSMPQWSALPASSVCFSSTMPVLLPFEHGAALPGLSAEASPNEMSVSGRVLRSELPGGNYRSGGLPGLGLYT